MFYTYYQNNSGGNYQEDHEHGISCYVIVEAGSPGEANDKAERIGLYFDSDMDCECCGPRWSRKRVSTDAREIPNVYGCPVAELDFDNDNLFKTIEDNPEGYVHYLDGRVEAFGIEGTSIASVWN